MKSLNEVIKLRKINRYFMDEANQYLTDTLNTLDDFLLNQRNISSNMKKQNCFNGEIPLRNRIKKLLVSDKVYKHSPPNEDPSSKEKKHFQRKCYCKDDTTLLDNSEKRFEEVKRQHKMSRNYDKAENENDDFSDHHSSEGLLDEEPTTSKKMTWKDIETIKKFRDKHYFECHSIDARKSDKEKDKRVYRFECRSIESTKQNNWKDKSPYGFEGHSTGPRKPNRGKEKPSYEYRTNNQTSFPEPVEHSQRYCKCKCYRCFPLSRESQNSYREDKHERRFPVTSEIFHEKCNRHRRTHSENRSSKNNYSRHADKSPTESTPQQVLSDSDVPKYILKIPEVYIKFPITESMIVTQKKGDKHRVTDSKYGGKDLESDYHFRRKNVPEPDSLALRHQKGYRKYK